MRRRTLAATCIALLYAAPMQSQQVTASGSATYANGTYFFTERYESWSFLGSLTAEWRRVSISASVPVVAQNGTVLTRIAGVPVPTGGPEADVVRRRQRSQPIATRGGRRAGAGNASLIGAWARLDVSSAPEVGDPRTQTTGTDTLMVTAPGAMEVNVADPVFGGSVTAFESRDQRQRLALEAWAKAPVASIQSGVGTGAWDYAVGASTLLQSGKLLFSSSATWWMLGDLPDLELRDAAFYSVSLGTTLGTAWGVSGGISGATRILANSEPPASATFSILRFFGGRSIAANLGVGLTETASDLTVGMSISASSR